MNKQKIKFLLCLTFILFVVFSSFAQQQVTKFGVVDTARVYEAYFRDTGPIRKYETKKTEFQNEIAKMTEEVRELQNQRADFKKENNEAAVLRLDAKINEKVEILKEYTNAKNIELETLRKSLKSSDSFYQKLYSTLERIAEAGGYSMILSLQDSNAILWYSPSVDITDKVIDSLGL